MSAKYFIINVLIGGFFGFFWAWVFGPFSLGWWMATIVTAILLVIAMAIHKAIKE